MKAQIPRLLNAGWARGLIRHIGSRYPPGKRRETIAVQAMPEATKKKMLRALIPPGTGVCDVIMFSGGAT
jgi:hypothetical protein